MSIKELAQKYGVTAGKVLPFPREKTPDTHETLTKKAKSGDVIEVHEGPDPHKEGERGTSIITVVNPDRHGHGFYYFYGKGEPKGSPNERRIYHSNMFVCGVESWKKIGHVKFVPHTYKGVSWTITGIDDIDSDMANVDGRVELFTKLAPKELKDHYDAQEDCNYHSENAKMVSEFATWVAAGNAPKDFVIPGKKKVKSSVLATLEKKYKG